MLTTSSADKGGCVCTGRGGRLRIDKVRRTPTEQEEATWGTSSCNVGTLQLVKGSRCADLFRLRRGVGGDEEYLELPLA